MKQAVVASFIMFGFTVYAQQLPQFRQFILTPSVYNPAAMAFHKQSSISLSGRWQMSGFGYEPRTLVLHGQTLLKKKVKTIYNPGSRIQRDYTPVEKKKKFVLRHFVGGQVVSDDYGAFRFLDVNGNYALNLSLNSDWKATLGLRAGIRNNVFLPNQGVVLNVLDPELVYSGGDATYDALLNGNQRSLNFSGSLGFGLNNKRWFFSVATMHGVIPQFLLQKQNYLDPRLHWNASLGYNIPTSSGLEIHPAFLVKKMGAAPYSFEFSTLVTINYLFWAGVNYHHGASAGVMAGMEVSGNLKIGYAIDFITNRLNQFTNGGHEIFLRYGF
ncbi:MAG: PorP/SprF family type IX secretion system membrane protein [Bacteroidetes bacterium]|nr:PorP/SprF family type IX secretion system membrane protein [Bacteroidota bacterium]